MARAPGELREPARDIVETGRAGGAWKEEDMATDGLRHDGTGYTGDAFAVGITVEARGGAREVDVETYAGGELRAGMR